MVRRPIGGDALIQLAFTPRGPFSLAASTRFLEGFAPAAYDVPVADDVLRLAFPVDGHWATVGVSLHQSETRVSARVSARVSGDAPAGAVRSALGRMLSLDVDGTGFPGVGVRDAVIGGLQRQFPGLRPVGFHSPYEAATWAVLSHRIRITQAAALKARLAEEYGESVQVDGVAVRAFPAPDRLRSIGDVRGLPELKAARLRGIADAALRGDLDGATLRDCEPDEALALLQRLPGIGPFSAELVLVRGACAPDVFPTAEPRLHRAMAALYDVESPPLERLVEIADQWRPYRSWASVLIRAWWEATTQEIASGRRA